MYFILFRIKCQMSILFPPTEYEIFAKHLQISQMQCLLVLTKMSTTIRIEFSGRIE